MKVGYCSWCGRFSSYSLEKKNLIERDDYRCKMCNNYTVVCRMPGCENMATHKPIFSKSDSIFGTFKENWASEFCAEHDGSIHSFGGLHTKLKDLSEYEKLFKGKLNPRKILRVLSNAPVDSLVSLLAIVLFPGSVVGRVLIGILTKFSPSLLAQVVAAKEKQELGLEKIKFDSIMYNNALGPAIFTALEHFKLVPIKGRGSSGATIIFVNGFTSKKDLDIPGWDEAIKHLYPNNSAYVLDWDAGTRLNLIEGLPAWVKAVQRAQMAGTLLAYILNRTDLKGNIILCGYSLGTSVIYNTLCNLEVNGMDCVDEVYLFGGAAPNDLNWEKASRVVSGKIHNFLSFNDDVLAKVLDLCNKVTNSETHGDPIGSGGINLSAPFTANYVLSRAETSDCDHAEICRAECRIINYDVSTIIDGHTSYKDNLACLFGATKQQAVNYKGQIYTLTNEKNLHYGVVASGRGLLGAASGVSMVAPFLGGVIGALAGVKRKGL